MTGELSPKREIDREQIDQFSLTILAEDSGVVRRYSYTKVISQIISIGQYRNNVFLTGFFCRGHFEFPYLCCQIKYIVIGFRFTKHAHIFFLLAIGSKCMRIAFYWIYQA